MPRQNRKKLENVNIGMCCREKSPEAEGLTTSATNTE